MIKIQNMKFKIEDLEISIDEAIAIQMLNLLDSFFT